MDISCGEHEVAKAAWDAATEEANSSNTEGLAYCSKCKWKGWAKDAGTMPFYLECPDCKAMVEEL